MMFRVLAVLNTFFISEIQSRIDELEEFFDGLPEAEGREADSPEFQMLTTLQDRLSVIDASLIRDLVSKARESGDWMPVEEADVSEVQDFSNLFFSVREIESLDLSGWDTSNARDMSRMLENLMIDFADNESVLSLLKQIFLERSGVLGLYPTETVVHP